MPLKTKTKSKPALRGIKIRIRRIANRNPRNIRGFQAKESKLKRAFAGFLIILAILILALAGNATQKSKQLKADTLAATSDIASSCAAQDTAQELTNLRANKIKIAAKYVNYAGNSQWEKIGAIDTELISLNNQIAAAEKQFKEQQSGIGISIARLENEVLLCADEESCAETVNKLATAKNCDKQSKKAAIYLEEQAKILKKYRFRDSNNNLIGKTEIDKIFATLRQYRAKTDNQQTLLQKCLADSGYQESPCAKSKKDYEKAWENEVKQLEKIATLATPIEAVVKILDTDINTLRSSQTNSADFTASQGLGWCQQSVSEANTVLAQQIEENSNLKAISEGAMNQLEAAKKELSAHLMEAAKQINATTSELNAVFKTLTLWKIFSGIF